LRGNQTLQRVINSYVYVTSECCDKPVPQRLGEVKVLTETNLTWRRRQSDSSPLAFNQSISSFETHLRCQVLMQESINGRSVGFEPISERSIRSSASIFW
jgi:hypothetical protein